MGSWNNEDNAVIRKKDLLYFNGDVRVTLEIEAIKDDPNYDIGDGLVHITAFGRSDNEPVKIKRIT